MKTLIDISIWIMEYLIAFILWPMTIYAMRDKNRRRIYWDCFKGKRASTIMNIRRASQLAKAYKIRSI